MIRGKFITGNADIEKEDPQTVTLYLKELEKEQSPLSIKEGRK